MSRGFEAVKRASLLDLANVASPGRTAYRPATLPALIDDHVGALFPDSPASISTFAKNLHKTTTVVAHRSGIRFGVFLAFLFYLTFPFCYQLHWAY
jgi:hypothetical protein